MSESAMQSALFEFYAIASNRIPVLEFAFHVPNGEKRDKSTAKRLKSLGVKSGVPDVLLPVPSVINNEQFCGLAIELKFGRNRLSQNQMRWLDTLEQHGWYCIVAYDWIQAAQETLIYLNHNPAEFGLTTTSQL